MVVAISGMTLGGQEAPVKFGKPSDAKNQTILRPPSPSAPPPLEESSVAALTNMPLKVVGPGLFQLGNVTLNNKEHTVSFPATLNLNGGQMEYLLVTGYGKTHESILRTEAKPFDIHVAMLLLGAKGSATNWLSGDPRPANSGPLEDPSKTEVAGDPVGVDITWHVDGNRFHRRAEDLVFNEKTGSGMGEAKWVYNGSRVGEGFFAAQLGGSVISLITDVDALVNSEIEGHDNDDIWTVSTNNLPPPNVPLEVTFTLTPTSSGHGGETPADKP